MKITEPEELAFPVPATKYNDRYPGMTLRDYFAAKAMQAWLTKIVLDEPSEDMLKKAGVKSVKEIESFVSGCCYDMADSMIEARKAKGAA